MTIKTHYTWYDVEWLVNDLIESITESKNDSGFEPEIIVPLARGGAIPGVMISHRLGVPMQCVHWQTRDGEGELVGNESNCWLAEYAAEGKDILIVDDILDTGQTMEEIKADWNASVRDPIAWGVNVRIATLFQRYTCRVNADFIGDAILNDDWVVFPWENDDDDE